MTKKQCSNCPWKIDSNPYDIRDYSPVQHRSLVNTIAQVENYDPENNILYKMQCHESTRLSTEKTCIGWLHNQLNEGNNIALRVACCIDPEEAKYELDGEQHLKFEDTLPKSTML